MWYFTTIGGAFLRKHFKVGKYITFRGNTHMKGKITLSLMMTVLLVMSFGAQTTVLAQNDGNVRFDTGEIYIEITGNGNVPKFTFAPSEDRNDSYQVFFSQIIEVNDTLDNGVYDPEIDTRVTSYALPSFDWQITDIDNRTDGSAHFNISSVGEDFTVQFNNHLTPDVADFKFDVAFEDYTFTETSKNGKDNYTSSMIVLAFKLTYGDDANASQNGDTVNFGDGGFFNIEDTASTDDGSIDVGLSYEVNGSEAVVYVAYPEFTGSMFHDPTLGVQASSLDSGEESDDRNTEQEGSPFGIFGLLGLVALIPALRRRI